MIKDDVFNILKNKPLGNIQERSFKTKFKDFYDELSLWYFPLNFTFSQKLFHYFNNDKELNIGKCKSCNNRCGFINFNLGYRTFCSRICQQNDIEIKNKKKNTCLNKYGVDNYSKTKECIDKIKKTCIDKYGVDNYSKTNEYISKVKQTNLEKFGKEYYLQTEECKEKTRNTCLKKYNEENYTKSLDWKNKTKETCLKKYSSKFYIQSKEIQNKLLKEYNVKNYTQTEEYKQKSYNTKKKNNSFNASKIEEDLTDWFKDNNFNFIRQYKSELYPFACDFYLPKYDLYIEIQGSWTHGKHPFNKNNQDDINLLNLWKSKNTKYYNNAIDIWTNKDVIKRNIAKENNIKYLEIFSTKLEYCISQIKNAVE